MADKKVTVTIGSSISVDIDPVVLRVNNDNAKWENTDGTEFAIVLPSEYPQPACGPQGSNYVCTSRTFGAVGTIKYTVTSPGKPDLDPGIDIVP
jgi:hypothetical protein